ncbi:Universal stress protein [Parasponia andersonii]|uniref:Universal stress protein n=1 Tax=Parasponia andersonii TaxID=3476 RepID=A0A2P5CL44_PARAD|nr:Universal stress protein [Parasponia andersonii]
MEGEKTMRKESRIVVAVDESEESMHALSWCLSNFTAKNDNSTNTTLVLLYVKPPPPVYSSFDAAGYLFSTDVIGAMEEYGKELVHSVMERAEAVYRNSVTDVNIEKKVGSGDAKDVICHTVEKLGADTLVMGSHGYGFFKRTLLGSVSDYCAKNVKCPVVIVKHPKQN